MNTRAILLNLMKCRSIWVYLIWAYLKYLRPSWNNNLHYLSASQHTSNCFFHYSVVDITSTLSSEAFHIILHIIFLYIYYYYWFVMGGCRGYKSLVNRCWVGWLTFQSSSVPYLLLCLYHYWVSGRSTFKKLFRMPGSVGDLLLQYSTYCTQLLYLGRSKSNL